MQEEEMERVISARERWIGFALASYYKSAAGTDSVRLLFLSVSFSM